VIVYEMTRLADGRRCIDSTVRMLAEARPQEIEW
jgi:hypothetical protein